MEAHVERPTRLADGKTYCACGRPWPCPHAAPDTPVSAILAGIKDRYAHGAKITATGRDVCASADDIPLLLAAAEAALKLADEWEADSLIVDPEIALRRVITAALAGEEAGSDEH
jgi:hypothetical protein